MRKREKGENKEKKEKDLFFSDDLFVFLLIKINGISSPLNKISSFIKKK